MEINDKSGISFVIDKLFSKVWVSPLNIKEKTSEKLLINTINTHSFITALGDDDFFNALLKSDILIPDGVGIIFGLRLLYGKRIKKIAGYDLFELEMQHLNERNGRCFFLGSSLEVLNLIVKRAMVDFPNVKVNYNSPPYKSKLSDIENSLIIDEINSFSPDVLFIGMTAPKQEKWAVSNITKLNVGHVCCIGAVFDYYAGTKKRAPRWMINNGFEWVYRLFKEPRRMWRRYLINNFRYILLITKERLKRIKKKITHRNK